MKRWELLHCKHSGLPGISAKSGEGQGALPPRGASLGAPTPHWEVIGESTVLYCMEGEILKIYIPRLSLTSNTSLTYSTSPPSTPGPPQFLGQCKLFYYLEKLWKYLDMPLTYKWQQSGQHLRRLHQTWNAWSLRGEPFQIQDAKSSPLLEARASSIHWLG